MTTETGRPSVLADEQHEVGRRRILTATKRMLAEHGFAVTVDQVADAAEVGRRTVFRYFATRDALLAAALDDWFNDYAARLPPGPQAGQDPRAWLAELALQIQLLNAELGDFVWEIQGSRSRLAEANETVFRALSTLRVETRTRYANDAWLAFGGVGQPPGWVIDAFGIQISGHASNSLLGLGRTPEQIADVVAATLEAVVKHALSEPGQ